MNTIFSRFSPNFFLTRALILIGLISPNVLLSQGHLKAEIIGNIDAVNGHQADRWYFGQLAGLDFRPQNPVADLSNDSFNMNTSPAIMADKEGNILFCTDGRHVFNQLNHKMPKGDSLHGFSGMTMPAIIVPKPGSDSIYYIFTISKPKMNPEDPSIIYGMEYHEIDMSLDSGLGDVTMKNKVLLEPEVSSKLTAVKHSNGTDYWVVAHRFDSDEFCSFKVTSDGVDTSNYVSSHIGTVHVAPGTTNNEVGYMKISPDGTKLALAILGSDIYEIFDFNASTGEVTNAITSPQIFDEAYGVEFSPDSRYLYATITSVSLWTPFDSIYSYLFQFDVNQGANIFENYDTIAVNNLGSYFGGMQLGTDGRIYVSRSPYGNASLSVIQNPKRPGAACNFTANALDLLGRTCRFGFPNFIQSYFDLPHFEAESICFNDTTIFTLQNNSNIDHVFWDFGDPESTSNTSADFQPAHIFSGSGSYQVQLTESYEGVLFGPYTITVTASGLPYIDIRDTVYMSPGSPVLLDAGEGFISYEWSTGETTQTIQIDEPGIYHVTVYNEFYCSNTDSVVVSYYSSINEGNANVQINLIYPNPGDGTIHLLFPSGIRQATVSASNIVGQTVWGPCQFFNLANGQEAVINLDNLPEGFYIIEIKDENSFSYTTKYLLKR